jgi:heme exporter protein A
MLHAQALSCQRGGHNLFHGISFKLQAGQWLHISGDNGSGKTSLLRQLTGLSPPDSGQIVWRDHPIVQNATHYHAELLYLGHHNGAKDELTALENLIFTGRLSGQPISRQQTEVALQTLGLGQRMHLPYRLLSTGQKRRVMLARLWTQEAMLWVLDEPFTALDSYAIDLLAQHLENHLRLGGMAVITSHQAVPLPAGQEIRL